MDCWAENYCKQYGTDYCDVDCVPYNQLKFLYSRSNIPKKYHSLLHLDLHKKDKKQQEFLEEFRDNIDENVKSGKGLVIVSSNKGNGKTSWSCIMMNAWFKQIAITNYLKVRGKFISVPSFLQELKDDFNRDEKEMEKFKKHIKNADLVVWDDIGAEMGTDWNRETLYNYINYRISNNLSQIYTSNKEVETLEKILGERIMSRILGQCYGIRLTGPDMRGRDK